MEPSKYNNIKDVNADSFMSDVIEASKDIPIIVDFWAPWCEPCKQLGPVLEEVVNNKKGNVVLAKIDIDQNQEIAAQLRIQSIPTVYTFYQGKVVDGFQGVKTRSEILEYVKKSFNLIGPGEEVEILLSTLKLKVDERNWKEVKELAQEVLTLDTENLDAISALLRSLIGENKFLEVKDIVNTLSPEIKNSKSVLEILSSLKIAENAFNASSDIETYDKKLKEDPENLDNLFQMAVALYGNGEISNSFDLLLKSIKIDRDWNDQAARKQLLEFFNSTGLESKETIVARRKLASLLFS